MNMGIVSETLEYRLHFYKADEHENLPLQFSRALFVLVVRQNTFPNLSRIVNQSRHGYKPQTRSLQPHLVLHPIINITPRISNSVIT